MQRIQKCDLFKKMELTSFFVVALCVFLGSVWDERHMLDLDDLVI